MQTCESRFQCACFCGVVSSCGAFEFRAPFALCELSSSFESIVTRLTCYSRADFDFHLFASCDRKWIHSSLRRRCRMRLKHGDNKACTALSPTASCCKAGNRSVGHIVVNTAGNRSVGHAVVDTFRMCSYTRVIGDLNHLFC